jgi:hypothetical protein
MALAICNFCSKPDNDVQVVCESRCLLCSRCQLVPAIRKLLVDHTAYNTETTNSSIEGKLTDESPRKKGDVPSSKVAIAVSGHCPLCDAVYSASMLLMVQSYREAMRTDDTPNYVLSFNVSLHFFKRFLLGNTTARELRLSAEFHEEIQNNL